MRFSFQGMWLIAGTCVYAAAGSADSAAGGGVGKRPYELDWAGRTEAAHRALIDFERPRVWKVATRDAAASFSRSREEQIWGRYVGKLIYRGTGPAPEVRIEPARPVRIADGFDTVTLWIYGNNWAWAPDPNTPQVRVDLEFTDSAGRRFRVGLTRVRWKEWFLCHRRLSPEQIRRVRGGGSFRAIIVSGGRNRADRVLYFDNLAVFVEAFPPLHFEPRPKRGIDPFPGQSAGLNTGPGRLPFPTRPETILPDDLGGGAFAGLGRDSSGWVFRYAGKEGRMRWRVDPEKGVLAGLTVEWAGRTGTIHPCVGGGVVLVGRDGAPAVPERGKTLSVNREGNVLRICRRLEAGGTAVEVWYRVQLLGKSLVVDVLAPGGHVAEVRYGRAVGFERPRVITVPYLTYGRPRPGVVVAGAVGRPVFFAAWTDWYRSNASTVWGGHGVGTDGSVAYNGGVRYIPKTDGQRNGCFERFFFTLAPRFEEVLPNIPNPKSPWKSVTGTGVWRAYGARNRATDIALWRRMHRYGLRKLIITDHETMWRDGGESFTFRTRTAPGKGGDEGERRYARILQDELGFVYGPYNNFTDFAPVNGFWRVDRVSRTPDKQLQRAWARCYAPKPAFAVEACEMLAPKIQAKFHFSTAYCDVHTAVAPWDRVDYDARVPGAGTFAAVFYAFGEIMLLQKAAWHGPVYSEGGHHFLYCGLTDGNYAQDQSYGLPTHAWLVDFDLRKLHPLCCNFGMGNPGMFYGRNGRAGAGEGPDAWLDRFLTATVAFGHPGFLVFSGGMRNTLRSYFLVQALQTHYTQADVDRIRYVDAAGRLVDTSTALARGDVAPRSQVATWYGDGTVTAANGSLDQRLQAVVDGRRLDLPPNGWWGRSGDGTVEAFSGDRAGHRCDYVVSPEYLYVDGRGRFVRFAKAAGKGLGVCRRKKDGRWEVLLFDGEEAGFAVNAVRATAIDEAGKAVGPAELRRARGLTWVLPVKGAFSYILEPGSGKGAAAGAGLKSDRESVCPGEEVEVRGRARHAVRIPQDARPGEHYWQACEGRWIDFEIVAPVTVSPAIRGRSLAVELESHLPAPSRLSVAWAGVERSLELAGGSSGVVSFPLPAFRSEGLLSVDLEVRAGAARVPVRRLLLHERGYVPVVGLPDEWAAGCCLRGKPEQMDFAGTGAHADSGRICCGGVCKRGISMHPPYKTGVGYTFVLFPAIRLPVSPKAAFRAVVGKGDGSDPGDGIVYRVVVVDAAGRSQVAAEQRVTEHRWAPISADLSAWAGKKIRLKLVADVGPADNSIGDWSGWADLRIESLKPRWVYRLAAPDGRYALDPSPAAGAPAAAAQLRKARSGVLHFQAIGLEGRGSAHETQGRLNGVSLGALPRGAGDEANGKWADVAVALPREAIATLGFRNRFEILNPARDCFKIRRVWLELRLAGGRRAGSYVSKSVFSQPGDWAYAEGVRAPFGVPLEVDVWFPRPAAGRE